jgi:hypothetical protein
MRSVPKPYWRRGSTLAKSLLTLCLLVCGGCTTLTKASPPVVLAPPADLTQTCQEPAGSVQTNQGMAVYLLDLRDALRGCNAQLGALRAWVTASGTSQK